MLPLAPLGIHEHVRFFSVTELFRLLIGSRTGTLPATRRQGSRARRVLAASDFPNSSPKVAEAFNHRIRSPKQVYSLDVYRHFSKFGKFGMHSHHARTEETLLLPSWYVGDTPTGRPTLPSMFQYLCKVSHMLSKQ